MNLYYAHLETQAVEAGTWVEPGQVIGAVGNSGNARTTPTHLHVGVYARGEGPLDPDAFLRPPRQRPSALTANEGLLGAWGVTGQAGGRCASGLPADRRPSAS